MLPFHVANACCHYLLPLPKPLPIAIAKCHCPLPFLATIAYNLSVAILVQVRVGSSTSALANMAPKLTLLQKVMKRPAVQAALAKKKATTTTESHDDDAPLIQVEQANAEEKVEPQEEAEEQEEAEAEEQEEAEGQHEDEEQQESEEPQEADEQQEAEEQPEKQEKAEGQSPAQGLSAKTSQKLNESIEAFKKHVAQNQIQASAAVFKKFFNQTQMSHLWSVLKRKRQSSDMTVQQAWDAICKMKGQNEKTLEVLSNFLNMPDEAWKDRLVAILVQHSNVKAHTKTQRIVDERPTDSATWLRRGHGHDQPRQIPRSCRLGRRHRLRQEQPEVRPHNHQGHHSDLDQDRSLVKGANTSIC